MFESNTHTVHIQCTHTSHFLINHSQRETLFIIIVLILIITIVMTVINYNIQCNWLSLVHHRPNVLCCLNMLNNVVKSIYNIKTDYHRQKHPSSIIVN